MQFKYNDLETIVGAVGDTLTGIFSISSIGNTAGSLLYWGAGISDGTILTGFFTNLTVAEILPVSGGFNIYFTGGTLTMYDVPIGSYNPTGPTDPLAGQICPGGVCPAPWLTADFVAGAGVDNPLTLFDESTATLISIVSSLTAPLTGTGDGQLLLTGGTAAFKFAPNFSIQSNLQSCPTTNPTFAPNCNIAGLWPLASFDPVVGRTVPEPETLLLMGIGLAALGFGVVRRNNVAT